MVLALKYPELVKKLLIVDILLFSYLYAFNVIFI